MMCLYSNSSNTFSKLLEYRSLLNLLYSKKKKGNLKECISVKTIHKELEFTYFLAASYIQNIYLVSKIMVLLIK